MPSRRHVLVATMSLTMLSGCASFDTPEWELVTVDIETERVFERLEFVSGHGDLFSTPSLFFEIYLKKPTGDDTTESVVHYAQANPERRSYLNYQPSFSNVDLSLSPPETSANHVVEAIAPDGSITDKLIFTVKKETL
jgi:hypothetical protein